MSFDGQSTLLGRVICWLGEEVVPGAHLAWMAVPDASDRDGEGEIDDENYRLHCVQARLIPL